MFGYTSSEMIGESITRIIPPHLYEEETQILARLRAGQSIDHYETVRVARDGHPIDVSLCISPLYDISGRITGASKIARDITERKKAENVQRLLIEELNHRVRNTLAIVQAIAGQSLRHARTSADFVTGFTGRILSLSKTYNLLTRTNMQGGQIIDLIGEQVDLDGAGDRISCSGPILFLSAQDATHLALVLHELATNARKYGALSTPEGTLSVTWEVEAREGRNLLLSWREMSDRLISAPERRGFGTTLIEQTVQGRGGEVSIHYHAGGIACQIKLPLSQEERRSTNGALGVAVPSAKRRPQLAQKRILVIEDHPLIAMDLEEALIAAGCKITGKAATFERAMQLVTGTEYDAALIDTDLGVNAVKALGQTLMDRNILFAFITDSQRNALPGCFQHLPILTKPFSHAQALTLAETLFREEGRVVPLRREKHSRS
jgi:PAS domain S-box-containing protein